MGFMDKVKGMLGQHSDKAGQGMDKGADTLNEKTGGKHSDKIQSGTDKAKDSMDRMGDDTRGGERGGSDAA
ncbi:antitoxin [Streptomyces armeniacus]|uniref:Antitoxin n=1 Tax=Streptomyces armeniacus TaxID=83291 RepID=A0A345XX53_9ACTN|nr:antitoxin [Streptomyces armeniacus]AXK36219.1 antitoxin [Streptomyces armeniacus]